MIDKLMTGKEDCHGILYKCKDIEHIDAREVYSKCGSRLICVCRGKVADCTGNVLDINCKPEKKDLPIK